MTLDDIRNDLERRLDYSTAPATSVTDRLTEFVNQWHRRILSRPGMDILLQDTYALVSTSGTAEYGLPDSLMQIQRVMSTSNDQYLEERSFDWLRMHDPGLDASGGVSRYWIPLGQRQVARQPSDASQLLVDSTSASDTGTAYLEAIRTGGYIRTSSVTMTGVTAVNLGGSDSLLVNKFYLSAAAVGTVTLTEDTEGGTELARIAIGQTYARYHWIRLYPTPSGETYQIDFRKRVLALSNATDEPLIPEDFHYLLVLGALHDEFQKRDDDRRVEIRNELEFGIRQLRSFLNNRRSTRPTMWVSRKHPRFSRLGSFYPSEEW